MSRLQSFFVFSIFSLIVIDSRASSDCADVEACFQEAVKGSQALTISYEILPGGHTKPSFSWCRSTKCLSLTSPPGPPANDEHVLISPVEFGSDAQGYTTTRILEQPEDGTAPGYATIPKDYALKFGEGSVPYVVSDFTIAATIYIQETGSERTIFRLVSDEAVEDNVVFAVKWKNGRLILERQRSDMQFRAEAPITKDSPWDMNAAVIEHGVYPFKVKTPQEPKPRLIELYLRFRADGKVVVDMATVNKNNPDILIGHIQDMGLYVYSYPHQDRNPPWKSPIYPKLYGAVAGEIVTQLVFFDHVLSDNEVLAFHARNAYFHGPGKGGGKASIIPGRWHDVVPCNSGLWMNSNQTLRTVCGDRPGLGPSPDELEEREAALPAVLVD